jgi:2',3'-cyclic-nucleotide 2'-phosphodiesterase/3'-nucleotidase
MKATMTPRRDGRRTAMRAFATTALLALAALGGLSAAQAQTLKLRLLQTTDVHMHLLPWDYYQDRATSDYGLALTATLIRTARAEARNTVLLDNGDLIQGSPLGDFVARVQPLAPGAVHPAIKVLNALQFDAATLGNHEFNFGLDYLRQALAGARFPFVSANVHLAVPGAKPENEPHAFTPYVILPRRFTDEAGKEHLIRVGVIGFVTPQIMIWDRSHLQGRVTVRDIRQSAERLVPRLRAEGADVVVVLAHSGFERLDAPPSTTPAPPGARAHAATTPGADTAPRFAENSVARLAEVSGIDAILFGHSHAEFPGPNFARHPRADIAKGTIGGVPAVMPGRWGDHLGVIDLVLERRGEGAQARWVVADSQSQLRPIRDRATRRALVEPDPTIEPLIAAEHRGTLGYVRAEVASTSAPIHSFFAQVADDPSVQIVSQAQLAYGRRVVQGTEFEGLPLLSAAAPFKTGGRQGFGNYTDIPAGPLAVRNVADLYIFPNTVRIVRLSGAQVREWLEMSAGQFNRIDPAGPPAQDLLNGSFPSFNFDTLDGLSYRIDVTQPARYDRSGVLAAPAARRIADLRWQGKPLDEAQVFLVVTNNYRASGGGNFPALDGSTIVVESPDENREALVQYLQAQRRIDPSADANWRVQPVPGVKLRFVSGAGGIPHLARQTAVRLVKDNGDGSALYELAD